MSQVCFRERLFEDLFDTAIVQRLVTVNRLRDRAEALWAPRRNGCAIVLALLDERDPGLRLSRNVWEAKLLRTVQRLGLPRPEVNYRVRVGGRVRYLDLAWPDAKVAVEFDGFVPHSTRRVFDDDRERQNDLVADGWTVFRVTASDARASRARLRADRGRDRRQKVATCFRSETDRYLLGARGLGAVWRWTSVR